MRSKPSARHHREAELALLVDGEGRAQRLQRRLRELLLLARERLGHEVLEEGLERREDRRDVGGAVAGVVLLHQRVVGIELQHAGTQRGFLAHQGDDAFERRLEAGPVALGAELAPHLLAPHRRRRSGAGRTRSGRQVMLVYWRSNSRSAACWSSLSASAFGGLDPVADVRVGRQLVVHAGEHRHRLGALLAAAGRHLHRLVDAQHREGVLERLRAGGRVRRAWRRTMGTAPLLTSCSSSHRPACRRASGAAR